MCRLHRWRITSLVDCDRRPPTLPSPTLRPGVSRFAGGLGPSAAATQHSALCRPNAYRTGFFNFSTSPASVARLSQTLAWLFSMHRRIATSSSVSGPAESMGVSLAVKSANMSKFASLVESEGTSTVCPNPAKVKRQLLEERLIEEIRAELLLPDAISEMKSMAKQMAVAAQRESRGGAAGKLRGSPSCRPRSSESWTRSRRSG